MANADRPTGFIPRRHLNGGIIRYQDGFKIASAYGTALYRGDAVVLTSGYLAIGADNSSAILGVFAGCRYRDATGKTTFSPYWPAANVTLGSEDAEAFVYVDPAITYRVQTDTDTAFVYATHMGGAYDLEKDHAGSVYTGQAGMEIDLSDTGTGQWRILNLIDEPGNAVGVNAMVEVINEVPLYGA